MTSYRELRSPCTEEDVRVMRAGAATMMQHHVAARWWHFRTKIETLISARAYTRRSMEGPQT